MQEARIEPGTLRALSRPSDRAAALELGATWAAIAAAIGLAWASASPLVVLVAMVFVGSRQNALAVLAHEAWHGLLFSDRSWNHRIGAWLCAFPVGIPYRHDRKRHLRHHREVGKRSDPDWMNYSREGRECPADVVRYLAGLLVGRLLLDTLRSVLLEQRPRTSADEPPGHVLAEYASAAATQVGLFALLTALTAWWVYPLLWLAPLATFAGFFANTRALLEHMAPDDDTAEPASRLRDFEAGPLGRLLLSPFHFHLHALHHAHPSIPHRNLPRARAALREAYDEYPLATAPGYLRSLARALTPDAGRMPVVTHDVALAAGRKPEFEERQPHERVRARCDFCGEDTTEPRTERLRDVESAEHLPPAFRELQFRFVRCTGCGLVYLRDRPCPEDLDVFYGDAYKCYESYAERGRIMSLLARVVARRKLAQIDRLTRRTRDERRQPVLLDYGCGSGTWLDLMRELGCDYELCGMDITPGPIEGLSRRGIRAFCCDEQTIFDYIEPASVDVIHLFHVIEHVPEPMRVLERLREALVPGGVLIGQTPNVRSTACRLFGGHWNQWHVPRHLVLFDHETLRRHAEAAGFEVERITSSLSGATQWALSALAWWAAFHGRAFRSTHEPLYPPLILACIPLAALESVFSHTCHMDFVLRRPR